MPLVRHGRVAVDEWRRLEDDDPATGDDPILLSLARWRTEREALLGTGRRLGVRLGGADPLSDIVADLPRLALIAVEFPTLTDGRGYTIGRLLRERHGFRGELRAVGDIVRDVYPYLYRCGFDAVEARSAADAAAWSATMATVAVAYQPAADRRAPASALRGRQSP